MLPHSACILPLALSTAPNAPHASIVRYSEQSQLCPLFPKNALTWCPAASITRLSAVAPSCILPGWTRRLQGAIWYCAKLKCLWLHHRCDQHSTASWRTVWIDFCVSGHGGFRSMGVDEAYDWTFLLCDLGLFKAKTRFQAHEPHRLDASRHWQDGFRKVVPAAQTVAGVINMRF